MDHTHLLGRKLEDALSRLKSEGTEYEVVEYLSAKPDEDAKDRRVVRVGALSGGGAKLVVCNFRTEV